MVVKMREDYCLMAKTLGYNQCKLLGYGANGVAIDIGNNKVLKFTLSEFEYDQADYVIGKNIDGMVRYHEKRTTDFLTTPTTYAPSMEIYAIIMDKAIPLSESDQELLEVMLTELQSEYLFGPGRISEPFMVHLVNQTTDAIIHSPIWKKVFNNPNIRKNISDKDMGRAMKLFALYIKSSRKLIEQGIIHRDPHDENLGWDPYGRFVFFDYQ